MNPRETSLTEARSTIGDLVTCAQYGGQVTIITRNGKPAAAIVPINTITPTPDEDR